MKTVIVGKFKDGILIEGRPERIVAERCKNGIKEISTSLPDPKSPIFKFKRNNHIRVYQPTIMDPFAFHASIAFCRLRIVRKN